MYAVSTEASVATKGRLWRSILHGAGFMLLTASLCFLIIRLLPTIASVLTEEEAALQYVRAISQGEIGWAWQYPLGYVVICLLLPVAWQKGVVLRRGLQVRPRIRIFLVLLWIGYVPVTAFALAETTIRTIPFRVVVSFIAAFVRM